MDKGQSVVTARQRRGAVSLLLAMVLLGVFPLDVLLPSFPALAPPAIFKAFPRVAAAPLLIVKFLR